MLNVLVSETYNNLSHGFEALPVKAIRSKSLKGAGLVYPEYFLAEKIFQFGRLNTASASVQVNKVPFIKMNRVRTQTIIQ